MDYLQICAKAFEKLLDIQYHIILGRKGKLTELNILFEPKEFHHLIGLHKLRDLRLARENREKIFYEILAGKITMEDLKKVVTILRFKNVLSLSIKLKIFSTVIK